MTSSWEKFEVLIRQEMRKVYSEAVIEHSMNPRNLGELEDADGFARITGPCGDTMSIWLKVNSNVVINAGFLTDGCGTSFSSYGNASQQIQPRGEPSPLTLGMHGRASTQVCHYHTDRARHPFVLTNGP